MLSLVDGVVAALVDSKPLRAQWLAEVRGSTGGLESPP